MLTAALLVVAGLCAAVVVAFSASPGLTAALLAVGTAFVVAASRRRAATERARIRSLAEQISTLPTAGGGQVESGDGLAKTLAQARGQVTAPEIAKGSRATLARLGALGGLVEEARAAITARTVRQRVWSAELGAVVDAIDVPVFACDDAGTVLLCNRAGERLFRRRSGRLAGALLEDLFTSTKLQELHDRARRGHAVREDIPMTFDGAQRVFEVSAVPSRPDISELPASAAPRAGVVMTLRDVTDVAEMVRLKTDFVANASHELRTPIASIRAAVETLFGCEDDAAMRRRLSEMIQSNVLRLEEMVADLLDLSNLEAEREAPTLAPVPFGEVVEVMRALFEEACGRRGVSLAFAFDEALEGLHSDRKLLHLIIRNLIDNAVKFSASGSVVRIEAEVTEEAPARFGSDGGREAGEDADAGDDHGRETTEERRAATGALLPRGMRLRVIDTGEGIPLKHQSRVFERFYQVDPSRARSGERRGTGLGLAIVKHAVRRLGGEVAVESVWQEGTTMTVDLPRCVPGAEGGAPAVGSGGADQAERS